MRKKHINKLTILSCLIVAAFITTDVVHSETTEPLEQVGKQDPFEMVKPLAEFKTSLIQKTGRQQADVYVEVAPELFVESIMLKFLRAANVENIASNMSSDYGAVTVDEETNSLIICDARQSLDKIITEIRKIDRTPRQILIEVVIVDVKLDNNTQIGVNWDFLFGEAHTVNYKQTLIGTLAAATATSGMDFGIINNGITTTVHALQEIRDVEILSSPRILVLSGQEAVIQTIEEIPYEETSDTSAGGAISSTQFKEVGITLTVTAILTDDDKIMLQVAPEQSVNTGTFGQASSNVPIIDSRKVQTSLLMSDGQVAIMGGLRKKEMRLSQNKIPLLGDLPLIGFLFSSDTEDLVESELIVFISPHIYKDGALTSEEMKRFNQIRNRPPLQLNTSKRPEFEAIGETLPSYK